MIVQQGSFGPKEDEFVTRRLREATKYIGRSWIPSSAAVFKRLNDKLNSQGPIDLSDIHGEIKSDFGLFAHYLRKIGGSLGGEPSIVNPGDLVRDLPIDSIREIFSVHHNEISPHDLSNLKDVQLARVRHSVISCSAVEALAHSADIDLDLAAVCALVRQLGHLFVSWNYPSSCVRATTNMEVSGETFEQELQKLLGFAPTRLGVEAAVPWCKNPAFLIGIGKSEEDVSGSSKITDQQRTEGETLLQLCYAGEVLAQINDPENYPHATKEWKVADQVLKKFLGPKSTSIIREKIEEVFEHYVSLAPNLFPRDLSPERAAKANNHIHSRKLLEANIYVKRCPDELKSSFAEVYDKILQNEASFDAVNLLVTKVIPSAGFMSGCVYLLDPTRMVLVPKLLIGDARGKKFKVVSCSCGGTKSHPVSEAFHCTTPLKEENVILNGDIVCHITGKFGNGDKVGILYLEFKDLIPNVVVSDHRLLYFKAIRQALNDCLSLR